VYVTQCTIIITHTRQYLCVPDSVNPDIAGNMGVRDLMYNHYHSYQTIPECT